MNDVVVLPVEITEIAKNVSDDKRASVALVLQEVFSGVSKARQQIDAVVVTDENDKTGMKLANTIRLGVRQIRLASEKILDNKREEVQREMLSYKTEDQLWLKAKQIMQIAAKEVEEIARYKEETGERVAAAKAAQLKAERDLEASQYVEFIPLGLDFSKLSTEDFSKLLDGARLQKQAKLDEEAKAIAAKIESDRLDRVENERYLKILHLRQFWTTDSYALREMSDVNFGAVMSDLNTAKAEHDKNKELIRIENERLKKEAEEKEKALAEERKNVEAERKAAEEQARKEREKIEKKAAEEKKKAEAVAEKLRKELEDKAEAERKAKAAELAAKKKAEAAPDKEKIKAFVDKLKSIEIPSVSSHEASEVVEFIKHSIDRLFSAILSKLDKPS